MSERRFNYIDGVHISVARKIARYAFGDDYIGTNKNDENRTYDVLVRDSADPEIIDYFKEYWGPGYVILLVPESISEEE